MRSSSIAVYTILALILTPTLASAQSCAQVKAKAAQAEAAFETCLSQTHGPCTQLKLTALSLQAAANGACNPFSWVLSAMQPDVSEGGRVNAIAVNPSNNKNVLVTSESGGMFVSNDGEETWSHVDTLPVFQTNAVVFLPANPKIVFATASYDYLATNGGGIWRSPDGGVDWTEITHPPAPVNANGPMSATEISIAPDTGDIYVATNFGISVSVDQGSHWTQTLPFTTGDPAVITVVAQNGGRLLAGGSSGISRSLDGGAHWLTPTTNTKGISDLHAFGRSPFSEDQAYAVDENTALYYTEDAGDHWKPIASAPANGGGGCGGIAFVKTVGHPAVSGKDKLDLYYSDECSVYKLEASRDTGTTSFDYSGAWTQLTADHGDTRDLAFDSKDNPVLLGTDGGLHHTIDSGSTWKFIGGGHNGYDALQIMEVKGQVIDSLSRHDLYFATQDNHLWSSKDTGATWQDGACCDGFHIGRLFHTPTVDNDQITYVACTPCSHGLSGALFANTQPWPQPKDATGTPLVVGQSFYIEAVPASAAFAKGFAYTTNLGATWAQYVSIADDLDEIPKLSWIPGKTSPFLTRPTPVFYQAVNAGWYGPGNFTIIQLARIVGNTTTVPGLSAPASVSYPAMNGFGGLGLNPTMFPWYSVFDVDPANPNHLIAPDIINQKMMQTVDGGENWTEIPGLTSLVTNNGQMLFTQVNQSALFPLASAVSFDPDNGNNVALGTWENGFFVSTNGGATWTKVQNSEQVPRITSFDWLSNTSLVVSSYGRGLWRATFQQTGATAPLIEKRRAFTSTRAALAGSSKTVSPIAGKPHVSLVTNNAAGAHVATSGQSIEVAAQNFRAGTAVQIVLDGQIVEKTSIPSDGTLLTRITAPKKAGPHTLTVVDATTGKVTDGSIFLVRPSDTK